MKTRNFHRDSSPDIGACPESNTPLLFNSYDRVLD
jgi:hypothetical protein